MVFCLLCLQDENIRRRRKFVTGADWKSRTYLTAEEMVGAQRAETKSCRAHIFRQSGRHCRTVCLENVLYFYEVKVRIKIWRRQILNDERKT